MGPAGHERTPQFSIFPGKGGLVLKGLFKNPITEWLFWLAKKSALERRYRGLKLNYLAKTDGCTFGTGNTVNEHSLLIDSSLGDYTYVGRHCLIDKASIGKFCSIGPFTRMGLGLHPADGFVSTHPAFYSTRGQSGLRLADRDYFPEKTPIEIGHDVWIGANALIKDGVKIGHGAIVAAGAVVSADVAPYQIVGGVPAKPIRARFPEDTISRLLANPWWDKDEHWLRKNFKAFHDIDGFLSIAG
jgi:acetyltransferase-like isoleucine patch superfamily enzyme